MKNIHMVCVKLSVEKSENSQKCDKKFVTRIQPRLTGTCVPNHVCAASCKYTQTSISTNAVGNRDQYGFTA